jgi:hypothetical protein
VLARRTVSRVPPRAIIVVTHETEDKRRRKDDGAEEEECGRIAAEGVIEEGERGGRCWISRIDR